jgi:hypothetical protein
MLGGKVKNLRTLYRLFRENGFRAPKLYPEPMQTQFELAYLFAVAMWLGIGIVVFVLLALVLFGLASWKAWTRR